MLHRRQIFPISLKIVMMLSDVRNDAPAALNIDDDAGFLQDVLSRFSKIYDTVHRSRKILRGSHFVLCGDSGNTWL